MKKTIYTLAMLISMHTLSAQNTEGFEANGNNLSVSSGTSVGIGTSNPSSPLEVIGTTKTTKLEVSEFVGLNDSQLRLRGIGDGNHYLSYTHMSGNSTIDGPSLIGNMGGVLGTMNNRGGLAFNPVLTWNSTGNVGIGTDTDPSSILHLKSEKPILTIESEGTNIPVGLLSQAFIDFRSQNSLGRIGISQFSGSAKIGIENEHTGMFIFNNSIVFGSKFSNMSQPVTNEEIFFNGSSQFNSNVGIGVPSQENFELAVGGRIICEELKVELEEDWPDYVFDEGYELTSLETLEKQIDSLGHLPNVPSSNQVADNGLGLGEMSKIQMEKIEELTLYLIELKKENKLIIQEINKLKAENNLLKP